MNDTYQVSGQISGNVLTIDVPFVSKFDGFKFDDLKLKTQEPEIKLNTTIDNIKISEVIGLNDAKEMLEKRLKFYLEYKDKMTQTVSKGIMLYGYPGTGKTMLVKAIMNKMDKKKVLCVILNESDLSSSSDDVTLTVINYFKKIRKDANGREVLLLMDEAEGIIGEKGKHGIIAEKIVMQILREIDGIENNNKNIFILATTNHPGKIEPAMLRCGRIDYHIKVDLPSTDERYKMIQQYCGKFIDEKYFSSILLGTINWTGANYAQLGAEMEMEYLIKGKLDNATIFKLVEQINKYSKRNFKTFEKEYRKYMDV